MDQLKLTEENSKQYISFLKYLESSGLERPSNYLMPMEIESCNTVHDIAHVISRFLGIQKNIVINEINATSNIAGNISEDSQNIYVNLDYEVKENKRISAGVLCHELMHHVLRKNNIENNDSFWNEILTDISTAYMGLGLVYLNGLNNKQYKYTPYGITTKSHRYGYMDKQSYIFVQMYVANKYPNIEYTHFINSNSPYCSELKKMLKIHQSKSNTHIMNIIPWIIIFIFIIFIFIY